SEARDRRKEIRQAGVWFDQVESRATCPDADDLVALASGTIDASSRGSIEAHLDECGACRAIVADLAREAARSKEALPDVLDGRFELGKRAGRGGMGEVYRARDRETGEPVAIKLLSRATDVSRFRREWEVLKGLTHPSIVRYVAHGDANGVEY